MLAIPARGQRGRVVLPKRVVKINPLTLPANLLDDAKYRRAAIPHVPLVPNPQKGYKPDSMYVWVDQTGKKHAAYGKDIVTYVNDFEKELNKRGHSLREKNALTGLSLNLARVAKNDFSRTVISNNVRAMDRNAGYKTMTVARPSGNMPPPTRYNMPQGYNANGSTVFRAGIRDEENLLNKRATLKADQTRGEVLQYVGVIIESGTEVGQGELGNETLPTIFDGTKVGISLMLVIPDNLSSRIKLCKAEIKNGNATLLTNTFDVQKPDKSIGQNHYKLDYFNCVQPAGAAKNTQMKIYHLSFDNTSGKLPKAGSSKALYNLILSFYNADGDPLVNISQPNHLAINDQLPKQVKISTVPVETNYRQNGFDYELLDPGLHAFGFYASSAGDNAGLSETRKGDNGIDIQSSVSTNMTVGMKYFNFKHLVSSDEPLSSDYKLFAYTVSAQKKYSHPDDATDIPSNAGLKGGLPDYGKVTLLNQDYDLDPSGITEIDQSIEEELMDIRFFVGPVPCRFTARLMGDVGVNLNYTSSNLCDISTAVTPHADITLHGDGGVDAALAYAKVNAEVHLLTISMPNDVNTSSAINTRLTVGGLSGQIYFQAGICLPVPFFDDICTDFRIDIFNWDGMQKTFKVDPDHGIVMQ